MWDFIKYCMRCFAILFSASGGDVTEGLTFEIIIVGTITWFVLAVLGAGILWLISFIVSIFSD